VTGGRAAEAARDKLLMRTLMSRGGAPCPVFRPFSLAADPLEVAEQVTYPCVVKPRRLSGWIAASASSLFATVLSPLKPIAQFGFIQITARGLN